MEINGYLNSTDGRHTKIYLNTSLPRGLYEGFKLPSSLRGRLTGRGPVSRTLRQRMNGGVVSQETLDEWTEPLESFVGRRVPQKTDWITILILTNVCVCVFFVFPRSLFASTKLKMLNRQWSSHVGLRLPPLPVFFLSPKSLVLYALVTCTLF